MKESRFTIRYDHSQEDIIEAISEALKAFGFSIELDESVIEVISEALEAFGFSIELDESSVTEDGDDYIITKIEEE